MVTSAPILTERHLTELLSQFNKDGSVVGSIGSTDGTDLQIGSGNCYLRFDDATNQILPTNARFKDLYLSGTASVSKTRLTTNNTTYWDLRRDSDTGHFVVSDDGLGDVFTILQSNGNVGIGTSSPSANLHIANSGVPTIRLEDSGSSQYAQIFTNNDDLVIGSDEGNTGSLSSIAFRVDASEKNAHRLQWQCWYWYYESCISSGYTSLTLNNRTYAHRRQWQLAGGWRVSRRKWTCYKPSF
jgi:hypothetical protein